MNQDWERMKRLLSLGQGAPAKEHSPRFPGPVPDPNAAALKAAPKTAPKAASFRVMEQATPFGTCLIRELELSRAHAHGNTPLEWLLRWGGEGRALLGRDPRLREIEPSSLLFLDLETTGLGGTGTYAFLVGLGFFRSDRFFIRQYFMRDYSEERALLFALREFLKEGQGVVSYNGKMFDLPLLSDRFILNRMRSPLEDLPHLDLLHPARRLWRERTGSCSLAHLEEALLSFRRQRDIPSELIPSFYFRYLRERKPSIMEPVFSHNAHDLLSLMALKARACLAVEDPVGGAIEQGVDFYCLGRLFEDSGHWDRSVSCYQKSLDQDQGLPFHLREEARRRLSLMLKRSGDRPRAVEIWQSSIAGGDSRFDFFSCVELAKHKEHQEKDYEGAILIVKQALERLSPLDPGLHEVRTLQESLQHRLHRLEHRLRGERWY
jgi:uncharacterized protein YprB with RNaseH-like and TPR domain